MWSLGSLRWRYPEWWCLALSGVAWAVLCLLTLQEAGPHHPETFPEQAAAWLLMTFAMMVPLTIGSIRLTANASLWHRRDRAIAAFVMGFVAAWLVPGMVVTVLDERLTGLLSGEAGRLLPCAAFVIAALWQLTSGKRRALVRCHQVVPLAPRGWRADGDCIGFGWTIGTACVISCWALMLACVLARHQIWVMLGVSAIGLAERYPVRPLRQSTFSLLISVSSIYAVVGVAVAPGA